MFGKELHKVEGYIQDKRYTCPPVYSAPSFYSVTRPFTLPCLPLCPVKRSTASSMGNGPSACGVWSLRCTRPTKNWRKRETRSWKMWESLRVMFSPVALWYWLFLLLCIVFPTLGCLEWNNYVTLTEPCDELGDDGLAVFCFTWTPSLSGSSDPFWLWTLSTLWLTVTVKVIVCRRRIEGRRTTKRTTCLKSRRRSLLYQEALCCGG